MVAEINNRAPHVFRLTIASLMLNIGMALIKWIAGIAGHSFALIADAIESTADIFSSILTLVGMKISQKPPDEDHPYGHGKVEVLITFFVVGFLVASATGIAYHSIHNIWHPHPSPRPFTLLVLLFVMVTKEMFHRVLLNNSGSSTLLKGEAWHHRSDAITSFAACIGISIALIGGPRYAGADDWAALVAAGFILYNSYLIFRPALGEMMDEQAHDTMVASIRQIAQQVEGVCTTEKCYVRKSGMVYFVDLHVEVEGQLTVSQGHDIAHRLKENLQANMVEIRDVLIHIEPNVS